MLGCCIAEGFVRLYKLVDNGRRLELVHKTAVGGIPGALAAFKGRLLAGVGPIVRLYDMGKKKLLRKSEYRRWEPCFTLSSIVTCSACCMQLTSAKRVLASTLHIAAATLLSLVMQEHQHALFATTTTGPWFC